MGRVSIQFLFSDSFCIAWKSISPKFDSFLSFILPHTYRLADPLTSPKTYLSILKTFFNNKKTPCIPPLFHENKFITDLLEKLNYLTFFCRSMLALSSRIVFTFFTKNNLIFPNQLGFRPGDSCVNQLLTKYINYPRNIWIFWWRVWS